MLKRGVYAASLSVLNKDLTLNVEATISHAENLIKNGLHGCFFFGSTGMSQLISKNEKKLLPTLKSRCQVIRIPPTKNEDIKSYYTEVGIENNKQAQNITSRMYVILFVPKP